MSVEPQATVWITGAAGRMGRTISARLDHNRYRVVTTDRELDIVDLQRSLAFAESERPSFVINCAALASRTEAEANPDRAYQVNALGTRNLAIASASVGAAGGVIAFYIGMLLIYFAIMLNIDELAGAQIPMLILAGRISPVTSGVFSILIVTGIYTASVPLLWQTAFRLAEEGSLRFKRIAVILAAAGIAASLLLPFNRLMNIVYVLIGYLGFLLLACMVLKAVKIIK